MKKGYYSGRAVCGEEKGEILRGNRDIKFLTEPEDCAFRAGKLRKAILTRGIDTGQEVFVHAIQSVGDLTEGVAPHAIVEYRDGHMDYWSIHAIQFLESPHG